jgi:hypothetical protein
MLTLFVEFAAIATIPIMGITWGAVSLARWMDRTGR